MRHRGGNEGVNWSIFVTTLAGIGVVIYYFYHLAFRVTAGGMSGGDYQTLVNLTPESVPEYIGPEESPKSPYYS